MFRRSVLSFEHDVTMNPWSLRNISLMLFFLWCREILHSLASFSQMTKWQKEIVGGLPKLGANGSFLMCSQLDSDVVPTSYPISISPLVFYLANPFHTLVNSQHLDFHISFLLLLWNHLKNFTCWVFPTGQLKWGRGEEERKRNKNSKEEIIKY